MPLERTSELTLRLKATHRHMLEEAARRRNLKLVDHVQRVLQAHVDADLKVPDSLRREIAVASTHVLQASMALQEAKREWSHSDRRDESLASRLEACASDVSKTLGLLRDKATQA